MVTSIKDLFIQSFKAVNPLINIESGFPVYDTMIDPNTRAFTNLTAIMANMESRIDYSKFFDDEGVLISEEYFDILRNNMFFGDGFATRGSSTMLLEFSSLQSEIIIPDGLVLTREGTAFRIAAGTYNPPVFRVTGSKIRYAFTGVSVNIGADVPIVSAGTWEVTEGSIPVQCSRVLTETVSIKGQGNAGTLTVSNLPLLLSRKSLDTSTSVLNAVNTAAVSAGIIPDKLTVCGYADEEYQSGIVPFEDEDDAVRVFRFGGYSDVRIHRGMQLADVYFEEGPPYVEGQYRYDFSIPVYAVVSVKTWIEGDDGVDLMYDMDYVHNRIITSNQKVKVTVLTTDVTMYSYIKSEMSRMNVSAGSLRLIPFFPVRMYVDVDCVSDASTDIEAMNAALLDYFDTGMALSEFTFEDAKLMITDVTGIKDIVKFKYILPDGAEGEISSGSLPYMSVQYGPEDLSIEIPLTDNNTLLAGGYAGVYGLEE